MISNKRGERYKITGEKWTKNGKELITVGRTFNNFKQNGEKRHKPLRHG